MPWIMTRTERITSSVAAVAVVTCLVGLAAIAASGARRALSSGAAAAGGKPTRELVMGCTLDMYTQFHIHPALTIVIDGEKRKIPKDVGITDGCMHPLHTHDDSGTLHVESPVRRDFTLGDFFAVWGQPFDKDRVLDKTVDGTHEIRLLVNGQLSQDYGNLVLHDKDKIMISYQKKPAPPSGGAR